MQKITVGGMDFYDLESGGARAFSGLSECTNDVFHFGGGEFFRSGIAFIKRQRTGGDWLPTALCGREWLAAEPGSSGACFSSSVSELNAGHGALRANEFRDRLP